ncbi:MAG TPA: DUF4249 domain-containing protein [Puia sp.]|nr:DUF4249 domain-containing protein [Puia sp.]
MFRILRYVICTLLICMSSCEKDISIHLKPTSTDLVVDASIENGGYPVVFLSTSLDYFSKIDPAILAASFVHNADVTISSGGLVGHLLEDSIRSDSGFSMIYYYSFTNGDTGVRFVGELGKTYNLEIKTGGQTYTATTQIPVIRKKIDSLWWIPAPDTEDTTEVIVKARIVDPPGLGDYTRYYTSVNYGPFYPGLQSVFDDQITDGTTYDVSVDRGVNRNINIDFNTYAFFSRGDTVQVKLANIDKATYDFWRTLEYNYQAVGNPFSSPVKVISNISNNALGYFGGYGSQTAALIIPK